MCIIFLQVLVKVHASGINPVDVQVREKAFGYVPPLPLVLGKEAAGVVEDTGNSVKTFKVRMLYYKN